MKRRAFITLLGGAAAAWPLTARAQQPASARLGILLYSNPAADPQGQTVLRGLGDLGYVEGRNISLAYRYAEGSAERLPDLAAELVRLKPDVILAIGGDVAPIAKKATPSIPIVFISVGNPIAMGLVESLSHPGGNATGFSDTLSDISAKLVQYAIEVSKPEATIDYLWHTAWPDGKNRFQATEQAARSAGVKLRSQGIAESAEIDEAIGRMKQNGATTVIVQPSPFSYRERAHIISSANGLATLFGFPIAARDGALIAYGPDYIHMNRSAPLYVDRILKGAVPADLPVPGPLLVRILPVSQALRVLER